MQPNARSQSANPLLGVYFGIFAASLFGIVVLLLIFEQLGVLESRLRLFVTLGSIGLYVAIGAAAYTSVPAEFFLSGRRVPPFFAGLAQSAIAIGGTGLMAFSGALFIAGIDALCVPLGIIAGVVASVVLIAPYFRKFGAHSVPGYLGLRFQSPVVRIFASVAAAAPLLLLLIAEVKVAVIAAGWLVDASETMLILSIVTALVMITLPGGVRSLSWSGAAQALTVLVAVLVPVAIMSVMATNLPLGQVAHGPILRTVIRAEIAQGVPGVLAAPFVFEYPSAGLQAITGRYAMPFASIGPAAFTVVLLTAMAGISVSPVLLGRAATSTSVYATRKSLGWCVVLAGVVVLSLSTLAVLYRDVLMSQIAGATPAALPQGLGTLIELGFVQLEPNARQLTPLNVSFRRDGVLLGLPILMGFPAALVFFVAAGVLAAALATAGATLVHLGVILAEDVVAGSPTEPASPRTRLLLARAGILVVAAVAALLLFVSRRDPLDLVIWSLVLSASALFPVMFLSIWWKRLGAGGAAMGLVAGFLAGVLGLVLGVAGLLPIAPELAAMFGVPAGFATAIAVTLVSPPPDRQILEMVRDLRVPSGEPVIDREVRIARQKRLQRR